MNQSAVQWGSADTTAAATAAAAGWVWFSTLSWDPRPGESRHSAWRSEKTESRWLVDIVLSPLVWFGLIATPRHPDYPSWMCPGRLGTFGRSRNRAPWGGGSDPPPRWANRRSDERRVRITVSPWPRTLDAYARNATPIHVQWRASECLCAKGTALFLSEREREKERGLEIYSFSNSVSLQEPSSPQMAHMSDCWLPLWKHRVWSNRQVVYHVIQIMNIIKFGGKLCLSLVHLVYNVYR